MGAAAVGCLADRLDDVVGRFGTDEEVGAEVLCALEPLLAGVERDDPRPIVEASCVAESPTGPWPKIAIVSRPETFMRLSAP